MKKIIALLSAALLLCGCASSHYAERSVFAMDTLFSVVCYGDDNYDAVNKAFAAVQHLEKKLSVTDTESEIYALNRSGGEKTEISAQTAELIEKTLFFSRLTGGALDPTLYPVTSEWGFTTGEFKIPDSGRIEELLALTGYEKITLEEGYVTLPDGMMLDFGATAKGYALEAAAGLLTDEGMTSVVLDFGGNIRTLGLKPDGSLWRAAVADPKAPSENLCILDIGEGAIATSGNYERYFTGDDGVRYCHIIDPADGRPVRNGIASVTVISGDALICDALSTALFVMGRESAERFWRENGGFEMVIVEESGRVLYTAGLDGNIRPAKGRGDIVTEVIPR